MNYWLFKSEPSVFSFEALKAKGKAGTQWDGVRNYAARNNMSTGCARRSSAILPMRKFL